jgi:succinyl-CoA synthetase beta subunit
VLCLSQVFTVQNIIVNFPTRCQVDLKVPVVVRLEGTNVDQGKRILKVRAVDDSGACFLVYMF